MSPSSTFSLFVVPKKKMAELWQGYGVETWVAPKKTYSLIQNITKSARVIWAKKK